MEEKKDYSKTDYRFSFVLSVTEKNEEFIIVKRDFNINNFDPKSINSLELKETIDEITTLIDRDIKSKSRTYTWWNMPTEMIIEDGKVKRIGVYHGKDARSKDISNEFTTNVSLENNSTFKFTFLDGKNVIMSKVWCGDFYPFIVRNTVDITNKRYKFEGVNPQTLDFHKSFGQRSSSGRSDISFFIMKQLSGVCSNFNSNKFKKQVFYKQDLTNETILENIVFTDNFKNFQLIKQTTEPIGRDDDKLVFKAYTNTIYVGNGKKYENISPLDKWIRDESEKELVLKKVIKSVKN